MSYTPNQTPPQFKHQTSDLEQMWDKPGWAWWWEQGTGKSREFIDNGGMLYADRAIGGMFMVAPNGLHRNFITQQVKAHLPADIAEKCRTLFWHGGKASTKTWQNKAREWMAWPGLKILGMSYDGITTDLGKKLAKEFLTSTKCLYGVDESARIKEPEAWRTQVVLASAPYAPFRRAMTGTPVANAPWDAWTQIKFVKDDFWKPHGLDSIEAMRASFGEWDKGVRRVPLGQAYWDRHHTKLKTGNPKLPESQRTEYFVTKGQAFLQYPKIQTDEEGRPRFRNIERLREILAPIRSRVLKKDVFPDLPDKIFTPLEFDLSPAQMRAYRAMKDMGFVLTADGHSCSASMALTVMLRLHQIACGYLVTDLDASRNEDEPGIHPITPNPRLELLGEITQDLPHQALIWARFRPDIDSICAMLAKQGKTFARYDGAVSDDECAENEDRFHRGDAQYFVSNPQKGGEGLTLIEARTAVYYSYSFKLIEYLQSSDRPHRAGQKNAVNEIFMKARGTIDERLVSSLQGKMDMSCLVTGDSLRKWMIPDQGDLFEK